MKKHNKIIPLSRSLASGLIALLFLSSCAALIDPYVKPSENNFRTTPSLDNAVKYAEDMREEYYNAISDYSGFNRFVGAALIGTTAAALGLGIGSGSASTISTLGLGGAGLFGLNSWLNGTPKQKAYQAGIEALTCTLAVFQPMRSFKSTFLDDNLGKLDIALIKLDNELRSIKDKNFTAIESQSAEEHIKRAEVVQVNGRSTLDKGKQAKALTARAGVALYDATQNIRAQVTKALTDTEGNVVELVASLAKSTQVNAGLITGKPHVKPPDAVTSFSSLSINSLKNITDEVDLLTQDVEKIISGLASDLSKAQLESCAKVNLIEAGISFNASPSSVELDVAKSRSASIIISGGKTPYFARWINQIPIDLKLGIVDHGNGRADEAVVNIEATADAKSGVFELNIRDSGQGNKTLFVSVIETQNKDKLPNTTKTIQKIQSVPLIKDVQDLLISLNCLPSTINGKPSNDGIFGTQTQKAIAAYFIAQEMNDKKQQEPFIGPDGMQNLKNTLSLKGNIKCSST